MTRTTVRFYIRSALWTGGLLLAVLAVASILWLGLAALGDRSGSTGARAVALVALGCWILDFVTLVILLALAEIGSTEESPRPSDETEPPS